MGGLIMLARENYGWFGLDCLEGVGASRYGCCYFGLYVNTFSSRLEKSPNFYKSSQKEDKCLKIYTKAQIKGTKYLNQTTFKKLKYLQQTKVVLKLLF